MEIPKMITFLVLLSLAITSQVAYASVPVFPTHPLTLAEEETRGALKCVLI